ncbi:sialate:O-sulfotransferase 2-like [Watersipora subatra]|uniref:sialate:O-sulfotransferase 2-like n=1 Tax=Watersipora subatra TaxID=2589382 RepID=UPI00355B49DC
MKYQGCYFDEALGRDLSDENDLGSTNTVQTCIDLCTYKGYKYAGLQGNMCYCGDSFGKYCKVDDSLCSIICPGNIQQICGGANKNSIYSTNYLGCWQDSRPRDFSHLITLQGIDATLENCVAYCRQQGYQYAGAQYFSQCFCGNRFGMYPELDRSSCNTQCHGNSQQNCGGGWTNSVFDTQIDCGCYEQEATQHHSINS